MSTGESSDQASLQLATADVPDKSEWATCLPECHWADDGSGRDSGRSTPAAIHATGCPHSGGRYVEFIPAPPRG